MEPALVTRALPEGPRGAPAARAAVPVGGPVAELRAVLGVAEQTFAVLVTRPGRPDRSPEGGVACVGLSGVGGGGGVVGSH